MATYRCVIAVGSVILLASTMLANLRAEEPAQKDRFVVHEWGVLVRGRSAEGPILQPARQKLADLPFFVLNHHDEYVPEFNSSSMEVFKKPVIHFYGPDELDVLVKIEVPHGRPLYYWPHPIISENHVVPNQIRGIRRSHKIEQATNATSLLWAGRLSHQPPKKMPPVPAGHWWNLAREINGNYFLVGQTCERFIFYEAISSYQPTIETIVTEDQLSISNGGQHDSGPILILVGDTDRRFAHVIDNLSPGSTARVQRAELLARAQPPSEVLKSFAHLFRQAGMTELESEKIAQIWRTELTQQLGFQVIYRIPDSTYNSLFPLTITPAPDELVRACLVIDTLFGQDDRRERLGWLPGVAAEVEKLASSLSDSRFEVRESATRRLLQVGDLIEPQLNQLALSADAEVAGRAHMLIETLRRLPSYPKPQAQPLYEITPITPIRPNSAIEGDR